MDLFQSMRVFTKVYQERSFSKVSQELHMNTSSVSRAISNLESEMDASLFNRNTRKIVPTEFGDKFYAKALEILGQVDQIKEDLKTYRQEKVKIHVSGDVSHFFTSDILTFIAGLNSDCDFEVSFDSKIPDILEKNYEFSLALCATRDSSLIARKLGEGDLGVFLYSKKPSLIFMPQVFSSKKEELIEILIKETGHSGQVIEVDTCLDAQVLARKTKSCALSPLFFEKLLSNKAKEIVSISGKELLGPNFGLHLVYTSNRLKHEKGKKILKFIMENVKSQL